MGRKAPQGKFKEKGVILKSALSKNVKVTIALWEPSDQQRAPTILAKPTVQRMSESGFFKSNQPYKTWLTPRELIALKQLMDRAAIMMDEYSEGTLDLRSILSEDEDARLFTTTESVLYPTIEGAFSMDEGLAEKESAIEKSEQEAIVDEDPLF